ncbi:MAG: low molecular weight phosphotyrosine protein phosphatase, partial [Acidimicrobiia bacterium]
MNLNPEITRVLFVCTGNICRSPLAEVMAADQFKDSGIEFSSAGTIAYGGDPAADNSQIVAEEYGLDLSAHRSRRLTADLNPDLVFGMEQGHLNSSRRVFTDLPVGRIRLLDHPNAIADPYGYDLDTYR